ncbi:nucleoside-diphosphate sugar epimerase [Polaribacter reichenbachii]|uniref:Nucleoside-diphosphate sugar epimerase n=1 Tax=Polaribacter reichenbachii TaxID=996801 RepID=A0A1B8TZW1_9FLAO|nr:NAD(P)H-binding protein [Polaribacter reichenbachii]APZ47191.1 nucleoside-diphosphate sugar epimerase [Polaribacter reichenbachii]AUC17831.1 nucleoside-diphosphate sugar epimerase [Polaribacter reichenbachii]OBY65144.1 nucleoside-diphosphate sugar epimerase [Polaribacter reichenbachii]
MSKTAIILGATGLTGNILLKKLIEDKEYSKIKLFSRNSVSIKSEKIEEFIVDLLSLEKESKDFIADEVFCCIGTTVAKTKDKELYKAIDYGIPVTAAKIAKENGIATFIVMSSLGADAKSSVFYNRTKGEMERDILCKKIKHTYILRPSLIGGDRKEFRLAEKLGKGIMQILNPLLTGSLKKFRMIHPEKIATCMQVLAKTKPGVNILSSDEIVDKSNN